MTLPAPTYTGPIDDSINNTAQGDALVKSNQDQAKALGITLPGSDNTATKPTPATSYNDPSKPPPPIEGGWSFQNGQWVPNNPTTPAKSPVSTGDPQKDTIANVQSQLEQWNTDYQAEALKATNAIDNLSSGATPLTASEQAQVDGLKSQFQTMIDEQNKINSQAVGTAQISGYRTGAAEYDPLFQAKTIGSIASVGLAKVASLQAREAAAVGQLTDSFKNNDIAAVKAAWNIYNEAQTARKDELQKTIANTQQAIKDAQDAKLKADTYNLDVQKFQQTKDQNAFDNALKTEQETLAERKLAEDIRHNKATEPMSGGAGGLNGVQSASMGATGAADPASQKQVLAQIAAQYGPMTAVAIQKLANYQMSPADWTTRIMKGVPGMTRAEAVTLAEMYDPTYDEKQYAVRQSMQKNVTSGQYSQVISAANTLVQHLALLKKTADTLPGNIPAGEIPIKAGAIPEGRRIPMVNAVANYLSTQSGKAAVNNFNIEKGAVGTEAARIYKGVGAPTEKEIQEWESQLSPNMSNEQIAEAIQKMIGLMSGKLITMSDNYHGVMGKPLSSFAGGFSILTPGSAKVLHDMGIDPSTVDPTYAQNIQSDSYGGVDLSGSDSGSNYNGITLPN